MKYLLTLILIFSSLFGKTEYWSSHSANVLPEKRVEIGLFQPLKFGVAGEKEWSIHPVYFFMMPNVSLKKTRNVWWEFDVSSRHSILYPTPLLNFLARDGTGGIISPEFTFPASVLIYNELLLTWGQDKNYNITFKLGACIGLSAKKLDKRTTIDLPLAYHRLAPLYNGFGFRTGIDMDGKISNKLSYLVDVDLHILPGMEGSYAFEHKGMISWDKSDRFRLSAGYKVVHGEYPFGVDTHLLPYLPMAETWIPFVDFQWAWDRK